MLSKEFLDTLEEKAQKASKGPDFTNRDPVYWGEWGNFLGDYIRLLTPEVILELIQMARKNLEN